MKETKKSWSKNVWETQHQIIIKRAHNFLKLKPKLEKRFVKNPNLQSKKLTWNHILNIPMIVITSWTFRWWEVKINFILSLRWWWCYVCRCIRRIPWIMIHCRMMMMLLMLRLMVFEYIRSLRKCLLLLLHVLFINHCFCHDWYLIVLFQTGILIYWCYYRWCFFVDNFFIQFLALLRQGRCVEESF